MGSEYNQLGIAERERIMVLKALGWTARRIGAKLGRHHTTISRELRRHCPPNEGAFYLAHYAEQEARRSKRRCGRRPRLKSCVVRERVEREIRLGWTPELIAGRIKAGGVGPTVSHEAIYQYIYAEAPHLAAHLPRRQRRRRPRGYSRKHGRTLIPHRVGIERRPWAADWRHQFGHWESDSMVSSRSSRSALNALVERKSRYTLLTRMDRKGSSETREAVISRLRSLPRPARKSITYDNGTENVEHEAVSLALGVRSYFCAPYRSWEKGTVENTIGLVRRFLPKGTDLSTITDEEVREIEAWLNNRPRKCLGYKTPAEVFDKLAGALTP